MANLAKKMSIITRSLRPQLIIAFCLMSPIPVLALLNFVFPSLLPREYLPVVILIVIALSLAGFILLKKIVDPIIEISSEARIIARGEVSRRIPISREDEIGDLSNSLNQLAQHIKQNMDELKIYGERTKEINLQINKQVVALNGLLQISNLISKNAHLKDIFEITITKLAQVASSSFAFLLMAREDAFEMMAQYGLNEDTAAALTLAANAPVLNNAILGARPFCRMDSVHVGGGCEELSRILSVKNFLLYPILIQGRVGGVIAIGNQLATFKYIEEDMELIGIFAKQLSIAIENDFLAQKVKDLEVKDALTGLYNRRYITARFDEEILRAISQQQPCSFIIVQVTNFKDFQARYGDIVVENVLIKMASLLKSVVREIDRAARLEDGTFGVVVSQKNKRQAEYLATQIIERFRSAFADHEPAKNLDIRVGVVENPIDGAETHQLIEKAIAGAQSAADAQT